MLGKHPFGLYEKALDPKNSLPRQLEKVGELGFDYMELSIDEQDERIKRLYWSRSQRKELRDVSFDLNIPIRSMCLSAHRRYPFGSADASVRQKAREIMERALELSCDLGIRVIQLAGYDTYYEASSKESVQRFGEGMHWAAQKAAAYQVMLGMEIMDTPFMNSITKHMSYESQINSPWYKLYPDVGNLSAWPENDVDTQLSLGVGSMVSCHLKDTLRVTDTLPGKFRDIEFGNGCVDFVHTFRKLEDLGYSGPYTMERWFQPGTSDIDQIGISKKYLEQAFYTAVGE